jgi:hypothetical protein
MSAVITEDLINKTRTWLGDDGIRFFSEIKDVHGTLNACWDEGGIPHPVHFREGMQVRNFLRNSGLCDTWVDHDFDDNWMLVIEKAIL